jgi:hypothetical protein
MLVDAPFNPITQKIIGAAIEVHRRIGPGLLESTYRRCLNTNWPSAAYASSSSELFRSSTVVVRSTRTIEST